MKNENNNHFMCSKIFFIHLIIFLLKIIPIITECEKDAPFLKNGSCVDNCTQSELDSKECEISNSIVKTQWMTNIIQFGDKNLRYAKISIFSNNDMIASTYFLFYLLSFYKPSYSP